MQCQMNRASSQYSNFYGICLTEFKKGLNLRNLFFDVQILLCLCNRLMKIRLMWLLSSCLIHNPIKLILSVHLHVQDCGEGASVTEVVPLAAKWAELHNFSEFEAGFRPQSSPWTHFWYVWCISGWNAIEAANLNCFPSCAGFDSPSYLVMAIQHFVTPFLNETFLGTWVKINCIVHCFLVKNWWHVFQYCWKGVWNSYGALNFNKRSWNNYF